MDKGTVVRTIALAITWLNLLLTQNGLLEIPVLSEEEIAYGLTIAASVWAWFRNNYLTAKGKRQKEVLKQRGLTK